MSQQIAPTQELQRGHSDHKTHWSPLAFSTTGNNAPGLWWCLGCVLSGFQRQSLGPDNSHKGVIYHLVSKMVCPLLSVSF